MYDSAGRSFCGISPMAMEACGGTGTGRGNCRGSDTRSGSFRPRWFEMAQFGGTMKVLTCIAILACIAGCGGGGGGNSSPVTPSPSGPSLPPPPPAPPPDAPAAATRADGFWRTANAEEGGNPEEWAQMFMYDGFVIMSRSHAWPSTHLMAAGVYQISGGTITAQFTTMRSGFPVSGFSGTVADDDPPYLDLEVATSEGTVRTEFYPRARDRVTFEELVRVWDSDFLDPENESSLTLHSDGSLFYQDDTGCAASGNFSLHDGDLLILSFDMSGCGISIRDGAYRGLGYSRGRDWEIGQTLWIAAANDTTPGQFFSWWLMPN